MSGGKKVNAAQPRAQGDRFEASLAAEEEGSIRIGLTQLQLPLLLSMPRHTRAVSTRRLSVNAIALRAALLYQ